MRSQPDVVNDFKILIGGSCTRRDQVGRRSIMKNRRKESTTGLLKERRIGVGVGVKIMKEGESQWRWKWNY